MLVWDKIKNQDRFRPYASRVLHFVVDDEDFLDLDKYAKVGQKDDSNWAVENFMAGSGFSTFKRWNKRTNFLREGDVFISVSTFFGLIIKNQSHR